MAWNRPETGDRIVEKKDGVGRKIAIALLLLAVTSAVAVYILTRSDPGTESKAEDSATKNRIPPVVSVTNKVSKVKQETAGEDKWKYEDGRRLPKNAYKDEKGVWRHPGGQRVYNEHGNVTKHVRVEKPLFKHRSENMIGHLLTIRPGAMVAGTVNYNNKAFLEDFLQACKEPVEILDTDTEKQRALKQEVEQVKKELLNQFRKGEDIAETLSETRKELQRLGTITREMDEEVRQVMRDGNMSDDDVADYVKAANILLEQKGARPLAINPVFVSKIRQNLRDHGVIQASDNNKTERK